MLRIESNPKLKDISDIITNPVLWKLTYGQDEPDAVNMKIIPAGDYLLIRDQYNDRVGCFMIKELTKTILEVHVFILPEFWGQRSLEAAKIGHRWAKEQGYLKTFTKCPGNCFHVLRYLERAGYKACGLIEKGIVYNKTLVPLLLFNFDLESL